MNPVIWYPFADHVNQNSYSSLLEQQTAKSHEGQSQGCPFMGSLIDSIFFYFCKIMDGIVITDMRTAAASAVATKVLKEERLLHHMVCKF